MNKTIIVTGGAGFIGSNFVFHMLNKYPDYRIVCLDKLTYAGNLSTLKSVMDNPNFRFVKSDICDRDAVYQLFEEEKPDVVVNFAAESHVVRSIEDPGIFLEITLKEQPCLWTRAVNMVLRDIIRCQQTKYMATFLWTDPTYSSLKRPPFTHLHLILPVRRVLICLCWLITEPMDFR